MPYFMHSLIMMLEKLPLLEDEGPSLLKVYELAETPFLLASVACDYHFGRMLGLFPPDVAHRLLKRSYRSD